MQKAAADFARAGAERALARSRPRRCAAAAAQAGSRARAARSSSRGRGHGRRGDPRRLPASGARAAGAVLRLDAEVDGARPRKDGRWTIGLRDGETIAATTVVNAAGAWADVLGGTGRRRAGRPGAQAAHRLHLRCARRDSTSRSLPMVDRLRRDLVHQARGRPVPRLAGRRDAVAALRRPARGDRHRHRRRPHRDGDDAADTRASRTSGRASGASSPTRTWSSATTPRSRASSGWPARAAMASRPARSAGRLAASLALGKGLPGDIAALGVTRSRPFRPPASRSGDRKFTLRRQALTSR